jgi:hypothetical protein
MKDEGKRMKEKGYKDEGQRKYVEGYGHMLQGGRIRVGKTIHSFIE